MAAETGDLPVDGGNTVQNPNLELPVRQAKPNDAVTQDQSSKDGMLTGKQEHCGLRSEDDLSQ